MMNISSRVCLTVVKKRPVAAAAGFDASASGLDADRTFTSRPMRNTWMLMNRRFNSFDEDGHFLIRLKRSTTRIRIHRIS